MFGRYNFIRVVWVKLQLRFLEWRYGEWVSENETALHLVDFLQDARTAKWRKKAWRNLLELPPRERRDCWVVSYGDQMGEGGKPTQLTNKGVRYVLDQYRAERTARRTPIVAWTGLVLAVGSLLIAILTA